MPLGGFAQHGELLELVFQVETVAGLGLRGGGAVKELKIEAAEGNARAYLDLLTTERPTA
jgi:hypothetical protein